MDKESGKKLLTRPNATSSRAYMLSTKRQARGLSHGRVAIFTQEITRTMNAKATEKCIGLTAQFTKASGRRASSTAKAL